MTSTCRILLLSPALCCCLAAAADLPPLSARVALPTADGIDNPFAFRMRRPVRRQFEPLAVHSGPNYVMAFRAAALPSIRRYWWMRKLELTAGYGVHRMSTSERTLSWGEHRRRVYLGVTLDLSEWLRGSR